jgi:hypothetical protein
MRRRFHRECESIEEKMDFVFRVATDADKAIHYMDLLNTLYGCVSLVGRSAIFPALLEIGAAAAVQAVDGSSDAYDLGK